MEIDGPVNVARLVGNINGKEKIIYLFMDIHIDPENQTECSNIRSQDIKTFLINLIDRISEKTSNYDFLIEIKPTLSHKYDSSEKGRYIDTVTKVFKKEFKDTIDQSSHVLSSKSFSNIRLHSIDIRDYMKHNVNPYIYELLEVTEMTWRNLSINKKNLEWMSRVIDKITDRVKLIYDIIESNAMKVIDHNVPMKPMSPSSRREMNTYKKEDYDKRIKLILFKILNEYKNEDIKKTILKIIDNYGKSNFKKFFKASKSLEDEIESAGKKLRQYSNRLVIDDVSGPNYGIPPNVSRKLIYNLYKKVDKYYLIWMDLHSIIMDIYFLRRFLDKEYIVNAVAYTGIYHSINYIYFLVKYFKFKITDCAYVKDNIGLDKMNKIISKAKSPEDIQKYFYPDTLIQCSSIESFPKDFIN